MSHIDLEKRTDRRDGSDVSSGEANVCFSEVDEGSCYSQFSSTAGGSYDDYRFADGEIDGGASDSRRVSDCSVEAKIEGEVAESKVHLAKVKKDCRIWHLGLESNSHGSEVPIELVLNFGQQCSSSKYFWCTTMQLELLLHATEFSSVVTCFVDVKRLIS
ncbi:hypothetical protein J1N35_003275 [Gossypium stocksii]|uniref:Uncharacterized protein n=1 Tax=Gossypium stocksii TaxID=47602 RepID=A0A9D4ANM1_9ROSI|nr:hypothetical protein J1N35_003275 [Gossypium stocksii]